MVSTKRVALITGCGKSVGIGGSTARILARAGIAVVASDVAVSGASNANDDTQSDTRSWKGLPALVEQIAAEGGVAHWVQGDVSSEADTQRMVSETVEKFGRLDILVNNAGAPHGPDRAEIEQVPLAAWEQVMAINARSVFLLSKAALPVMRRNGWGRIINISSAAITQPLRHRTVYIASKAAVAGFTVGLSADVARHGITVNAICPGSTLTSRAISTARRNGATDLDAAFAESAKGIPAGRHAKPEDIANVIAFLASDASSYMTGQVLYVDGGGIPRANV